MRPSLDLRFTRLLRTCSKFWACLFHISCVVRMFIWSSSPYSVCHSLPTVISLPFKSYAEERWFVGTSDDLIAAIALSSTIPLAGRRKETRVFAQVATVVTLVIRCRSPWGVCFEWMGKDGGDECRSTWCISDMYLIFGRPWCSTDSRMLQIYQDNPYSRLMALKRMGQSLGQRMVNDKGRALKLDGFWFPHVPAEVLSKSMRRSVRFQSWLLAHSWERWAIEETRDIMPSQSVLKPSRDWRSWFSGGRNADSMWHRPCWCRICKQGFVLSTIGLSFMVASWWFWIGFTTLLDLPWQNSMYAKQVSCFSLITTRPPIRSSERSSPHPYIGW